MHDNTAMPTIEFGEGNDYDSLYAILYQANVGLFGEEKAKEGHGFTWAFHLEDGSIIVGTFVNSGYQRSDDITVIALHSGGSPTGELRAVKTDDITRIVYL